MGQFGGEKKGRDCVNTIKLPFTAVSTCSQALWSLWSFGCKQLGVRTGEGGGLWIEKWRPAKGWVRSPMCNDAIVAVQCALSCTLHIVVIWSDCCGPVALAG